MITPEANAMILQTVVEKTIDNIDVISVSNASGEIFRKQPQSVESISNSEKKFTFYLTEDEAIDTIVKFSLYGDGATTTLGTGLEMVTQAVNIVKTNTQSLLIVWTLKVI